MGSRCVKFGVIALTLSYWSLEVQHGTSWQRTLWGSEKRIVALHKDGIGYKKIAKTLKLSCSTVAKTIQDRFHSEQASPWSTKEVECTCSASYPEVVFGKYTYECCQHCCRGWRGGGSACQCSDHTPHTASNWSAWLSSQNEASSKDDAQESPLTVCWR